MLSTVAGAGPVTTPADLRGILLASEGFSALIAELKKGHSGTVDGAWGSSAALVAAALAEQVDSTLLIALPHPGQLDSWVEDLATFLGERPLVFPARENNPGPEDAPDELESQRLRVLKQLDRGKPPRALVCTFHALMQHVPGRDQLALGRKTLAVDATIDLEQLLAWLVENGYQHVDLVEAPGQLSRRGGIVDVFSLDADAPVRIELFGDEIESLRQFSPQTQRSLGTVDSTELLAAESGRVRPVLPLAGHVPSVAEEIGKDEARAARRGGRKKKENVAGSHLSDHLPKGAWTMLVEPHDLHEQGKQYLQRAGEEARLFTVEEVFRSLLRLPNISVAALPSPSTEATCHLRIESVERFSGNVKQLRDELDTVAAQDRVVVACHNEGELKRLGEVLASGQLAQSDRLRLAIGHVGDGFRMVDQGLVVLGDHELFQRDETARVLPRRRLESRAIDSFLDLAEGDLVVHVSHGIARYRGMKILENHGRREEHLVLEFREGTRLYVPAARIELVQKYVGGAKADPELSRLGGTSWENRKKKVEAAVLDLAADMIEMQALREAKPGIAYPADSDWQKEFEAAFPYEETPDQLTTMEEIRRDMERPRPMDRLVCGDVGYGKTELAMRAAFKTVDSGKQVAVLVPTTVLAEQHFRTFSQRFAEYPFVVEGISRFRSPGEQRRIVQRLAQGGVDIIIGTHRLLSADVQLKDLGLVIIDEEQRFGVEHKDRFKKLRQTVDVLTLTATPIPRTLHLSLLGIRDISNLETPPPDRLAIETRIVRWDPQLIRHAILRELNREGQVYFVHNRVHNIQYIADRVAKIVPEARIAIGHGQMAEGQLEEAMLKFVRRECDILVSTTIIESGLDIPNANTIFINEAENYGLADLHQLRGRVGRSKHRAYAYMVLNPSRGVAPNAARRLKAIEEFTELGAGFKIALRDLEIRGAGNILGTQQSGHIAAVGYELYCQMLENSVRRLKNQPLRTPLEVQLDLPWQAYLPHEYISGQRSRLEVYRRLARVRQLDRLAEFRQELRDRYGAHPEPVEWMLRLTEVRLLAARWKIDSIRLEGPSQAELGPTDLVLNYKGERLIRNVAERSGGRLRVVDAQSAYFRLSARELQPDALYRCIKDLLRFPKQTL
jgi:transcription-repair coupling factor (superfamily II helicase)